MKRKKSTPPQNTPPPKENPLITAINLQQQGKVVEAEAMFRLVLGVAPDNAAALYSLALILINSGRPTDALQLVDHGTAANPEFAPLWFMQGTALQALHRREEALLSYDRALVANADYIEALVNSGVLLHDMRRFQESLARFSRVLELDPENETALGNYGILLTEFKLGEQAVNAFERLIQKNPNYPFALGLLGYERMHLCDWSDLDATVHKITEGIREGKRTCKTLGYMAFSDSAGDHYLCAKIFADTYIKGRQGKGLEPLWRGEVYQHARKRIAYVSPDLREHPVGHLVAGVIEAHDKSRFEIIAISLGIDDGSHLRTRMMDAFDHFIDAKDMSARQIAELMRRMEIDIAIDLAGYTTDSRTEVFLHRPAPIQINYLGYPGTMGLDCYDYIIADHTVIPEDHQAYYTEKPAYLSHCYLPLASGVEVAKPLSRGAYGLPQRGFIFCAFSHDYKIHPNMFAVWMRLLESNPGSVLWLVSRNEASQKNLQAAAQNCGIDAGRLVFASRVPKVEDHLGRYRVADLFLDTWPYNAHTTAADALLAGLPVITLEGNAFPARVAASLLKTLGLRELVTHSFEEYFQLANSLAKHPRRLQKFKKRITAEALQNHTFIGPSFTRSLEALYEELEPTSATPAPALDASTPAFESREVKGSSNLEQVEQMDPALGMAKDLMSRGNYPQAEIMARSMLKHNGGSAATSLIEELRSAYGIPTQFDLSERAPSNHDRRKKFLVIKAWGYGFWSEGHHLASQLLLAELTQRTPIILWGTNNLFRHEDDFDASSHYFEEISSARLEDIPKTATIYPSKWSLENLREENVNKWEGEGSRLAAQYLFVRAETVLVSDFFSTICSIQPWIGRSSKYYGKTDEDLYAEMFRKYLKPVPGIAAKADNFFDRHMRGRPWVAVHMRGSDKLHESPNLTKTNTTYFGFVDRIVELNPSIGVFLLTDAFPLIDEFQKRYQGRLLCTQAIRSTSDVGVHLSGHDGVALGEEVFIDTLLALKCEYFVGNRESNVSLAIASMRDWPKGFLFLLGDKSGRSENLFLHNRNQVQQEYQEPPILTSKNYQIGRYNLELPQDHKLDEIQKVWRRYDHPMAEICTALAKSQGSIAVIDIGANVGDTAAIVCQVENARVLAIEGNPKFLTFLRRNAKHIGPRVTIEGSFIGNTCDRVVVQPSLNAGTASVAVIQDENTTSYPVKSIEEIVAAHPRFSHPDLIKIDTDGFDFAILGSMKSWLEDRLPALFFEFDPSFSATGVADGLKAIEQLEEIGYNHFIIFDNFGNPLCEIEENHRRRFSELCNWLASNRKFGTSVWYLDVLALVNGRMPWLDDLRTSHTFVSAEPGLIASEGAGRPRHSGNLLSGQNRPDPQRTCRLCGAAVEETFGLERNTPNAIIVYRCIGCGSLQAEMPSWQCGSNPKIAKALDTGKASRTLSNFLSLPIMFKILGIQPADRCADVGGGTGLFARLMRDIGYNFYSYEKDRSGEFSTGYNWGELDRPLKLVTIFESAELFAEPAVEWDAIFEASPDYILGSTCLYIGQCTDWIQLFPEPLQRTFMYSPAALTHIATQHGWNAYLLGGYFLLSRFPVTEKTWEELGEWIKNLGSIKDESLRVWLKGPLGFANADSQRLSNLAQLRRSGTRIALDGTFFRFATGISRLWKSLLAEWSANGFGEFIVVLDRGRTAPRFAGIAYVDIPLHNYADRQRDRRMLQEVCDRERISLFTSTYYTTPLTTPAILLVPDMIPEIMGFNLDDEQWREKHDAIRYCRCFLSISHSTTKDLMRFFPEISPEHVVTAHCGTDFRTPSAEQVGNFKARHRIDRPYFMISGVKSDYKNTLLFFHAFQLLGERRDDYAIVCTNSKPILEPEFAECVGTAEVHLLVLSDEDLQCAYAGALALVYPSRYEGFGLPILEAMACSCPVITCNNSSITEVAGDASIYVDPDDPLAMLEALLAVQKDTVKSGIVCKGKLRAVGFSWRKMADTVEEALIRWSTPEPTC